MASLGLSEVLGLLGLALGVGVLILISWCELAVSIGEFGEIWARGEYGQS